MESFIYRERISDNLLLLEFFSQWHEELHALLLFIAYEPNPALIYTTAIINNLLWEH